MFTIDLLTSEFGQVWARFNIGQLAKYYTTLGNMGPWKQNCIRLCKAGITKSHTTLGSHDVTCRKLPKLARLRHSQTFRKLAASSAAASCFSKTPPCPTLKNGRQPVKRLPENVRFTASLLRLAASEYISQTTKNSGEILKQLDSQGISFFISINIFGKSFADVHKKANWLCRIEWHLWCMLLQAQ